MTDHLAEAERLLAHAQDFPLRDAARTALLIEAGVRLELARSAVPRYITGLNPDGVDPSVFADLGPGRLMVSDSPEAPATKPARRRTASSKAKNAEPATTEESS